jgi:uncharacterized membrane protein YhaH (DUF805 family)
MFLVLLSGSIFTVSLVIRRTNDLGGIALGNRILYFYKLEFVIGLLAGGAIVGTRRRNKYGNPPKPGIDFKALFGFA